MFKLIKIKDGRINVPETEVLETDGVSEYRAGCVYFVGAAGVSNSKSSDFDPIFIPLETIPKNSGIKKLHGYFANSSMVFETKIYEGTSSLMVGTVICYHMNDNGDIDGAEANEGENLLLLSKDNIEHNGTVEVALKW